MHKTLARNIRSAKRRAENENSISTAPPPPSSTAPSHLSRYIWLSARSNRSQLRPILQILSIELSPSRRPPARESARPKVRGRTSRAINLKYPLFFIRQEIYSPLATMNIPLYPLMLAILLDNPSFARRLMRYSALDQSRIIARYINLLPADSAIF